MPTIPQSQTPEWRRGSNASFEELSFIAGYEYEYDSTDDSESNKTPDMISSKQTFHYEPGVIRKMKKSGKYAINNDCFESKSRPVSVASIHDGIGILEDAIALAQERESKESKFNSVHKPVLFLKSCPSPGLSLNKKVMGRAAPDPESLIDKLSVLNCIMSDGGLGTGEICSKCGLNHGDSDHCLLLTPNDSLTPNDFASDASDTEIHCNPIFADPANPKAQKLSGKRKKKRRKIFKFVDKTGNDTDSASD